MCSCLERAYTHTHGDKQDLLGCSYNSLPSGLGAQLQMRRFKQHHLQPCRPTKAPALCVVSLKWTPVMLFVMGKLIHGVD